MSIEKDIKALKEILDYMIYTYECEYGGLGNFINELSEKYNIPKAGTDIDEDDFDGHMSFYDQLVKIKEGNKS